MPSNDDYGAYPNHPLHGVPAEILTAARQVLRNAADWHDVDADLAEPIADSVVRALLPWLSWASPNDGSAAP